jgi:uncharacterized protein YcbK (DUF882 family)
MDRASLVTLQARVLSATSPLSTHFTVAELSCRHCRKVFVSPVLIEMLERLRSMAGTALVINSGYRCPTHNRQLGGAPESAHCLGLAADISVPERFRPNAGPFLDMAEAVAREVRGGYHYYPGEWFVHIDCQPYPADRRW